MPKICIFPIPGCVTFPGTIFPLHVFEPRYREMIQHCLDTGTPVAICHTRKELSAAKPTNDLKEALSSNQATYQPFDVFSAGRCQLVETLDDGRMVLNVHIEQRYKLGKSVQMLPYQVYDCFPFLDHHPTPAEEVDNLLLKEKILHRLEALAHADPQSREALRQVMDSAEWQQMGGTEFSFRLFSLIQFAPELLQQILEMDSAHQRLSKTLEWLNLN
ncbi:MAG: LON peptidase substrate-binding domain-containing protein [Oceanospirillaceae bacterium]|nr:LON peptidase substrate-binding domain-containing protein [Oceanospirillaceae bacterium]